MKRWLAAAMLTMALGGPVGARAAQNEAMCPAIGELAAAVMGARQSGVIMSTAMGIVASDNPLYNVMTAMVKDAYSKPQYSVEGNRQQAVIEFRNDMELACYTAD